MIKMRILIHAINGVGLGHIFRCLNIADSIKEENENIHISFVTNSLKSSVIINRGYDVRQLKYNTKQVLDNEITYEKYLQSNTIQIKKTIDDLKPDMCILDSEINKDVILFCKQKGIKVISVIRKSINMIEKLKLAFHSDLIIIPHLSKEFSNKEIECIKNSKNHVFTGPILNKLTCNKVFAEKNKKHSNKYLRILFSFSGGANIDGNKKIFDAFLLFIKDLERNDFKINDKEVNLTLIKGPFFDESTFSNFSFDKQIKDRIKSYQYVNNLIDMMNESDVVISGAGYNSVNDILQTKKRNVLVLVDTKFDSQEERALSLIKKGCSVLYTGNMYNDVVRALKINLNKFETTQIKSGNCLAAKSIFSTFKKNKVAILRGELLPNTERFIYDDIVNMRFYDPVGITLKQTQQFPFEVICKNIFEKLWQPEYPLVKKENLKIYNLCMKYFYNKLKIKNVDILHAEFITDALFFLPLIEKLSKPLIVSVRGYDLYCNKFDLSKLFLLANKFFVRSEKMKQDLIKRGCNSGKIIVIKSGIDIKNNRLVDIGKVNIEKVDIENNLDNDIIRFVMIGRLTDKKNTLDGIKAFENICINKSSILSNAKLSCGIDLSLDIFGDGKNKNYIKKYVENSRCKHKIKLHGFESNKIVNKILLKSDILFHPSKTARNGDREGIPNSIMEAMLQNTIVIASDNGSIGELVLPGKTGYLFKEGNIEEFFDLAQKVFINIVKERFSKKEEFKEEKTELKTIKKSAYLKVCKQHDVLKNVNKIELEYSKLLENDELWLDEFYENYKSINLKDKPIKFRVDIHPVKGCNSFCVMCDNWKNPLQTFFKFDKLKNMVDDLIELGVSEIRFHGQEPTLYDKIFEVIKYVKTKGVKTGIKTNANNVLVMDKILPYLDKIYLSIDSPDEKIHNYLRGNKKSYDNNLDVIIIVKKFKKEHTSKPILLLNSVITNKNYKSLLFYPEFASRNNVKRISFVMLNKKNKKEVDNLNLDNEQLNEFFFIVLPEIIKKCILYDLEFDMSPFFVDLVNKPLLNIYYSLLHEKYKYIEEIKNYSKFKYGKKFFEKYNCYSTLDHCTINYDGNIFPCSSINRVPENSVGNINNKSSLLLWNNDKWKNARRALIRNNGIECSYSDMCCSNFSIRKYMFNKLKKKFDEESKNALFLKKSIDKFQFLNLEDKKQILDEKKNAIHSELKNVEFYRNLIKKRQINSVDSFDILTKKEVQLSAYTTMINSSLNKEDLIIDRSSGSIDNAVPIMYNKGFERYVYMVYPWKNLEWKWGEKYFVFSTLHCSRDRCSSDNLPNYVNRVKLKTSDNIFKDSTVLSEAYRLLKNEEKISKDKPFVHGDPFYLAALAKYIEDNNLSLKLKGISSTYEILLPGIRKYLENIFECNIINCYGCTEIGPIAYECKCGNMHVFEDRVIAEIQDDSKIKKQGKGHLLVTSLTNYAMPLIRYQNGDYVEIKETKCDCGVTGSIIKIFGRSEIFLMINKEKYYEYDLGKIMDIEGIVVFQFEHDGKNNLKINIVTTKKSNYNTIVKKIYTNFEKILPKSFISVNNVDYILPEKSGKFSIIKKSDNKNPNNTKCQ